MAEKVSVLGTSEVVECYCSTRTSTFPNIAPVCKEWLQGGNNNRCARCGHWKGCHPAKETSIENG